MSGYHELNVEQPEDLFSRDGHLTILTLDRFDEGELSIAHCDVVIDHIRDCNGCSSRLDEIHADVAIVPPPHLLSPRKKHPTLLRTLAVGATLAAAASLLLIAWPKPEHASRQPAPENVLTVSPYTTSNAVEGTALGLGLDLTVRTADRPLQAGDVIREGDALTLEVTAREKGYIAVLVSDADTGEDFADDGTGGVDPLPDFRVLLAPTAVERDATLRFQHAPQADVGVLAVLCGEPFSLAPDEQAIDLENPIGCAIQELDVALYLPEAAAS